MLWIRMAIRDLLKNKGYALFFIINLSVGLAGFIAIQSFGRSLGHYLDENLKEILTADLVIRANSPMTPEEIMIAHRVLGTANKQARLIQLYTMARTDDTARLIQVLAIDDAYPLYGRFRLENNRSPDSIQAGPGIFMTRDTAHFLGLQDTTDEKPSLILGNKSFQVLDFFSEDPDKSLTTIELAPKIYIGITPLEETGLIQFGSRIRYSYFYRFIETTDIAALTDRLHQAFSDAFPGPPRFRIQDSRDVNQRVDRMTRYFVSYMGLVSVVALFLAGIATAYLFRGYLNLRQKEIAIFMSMGTRQWEIWLYMSVQLLLLGFSASILAIFISRVVIEAFPIIFQGLIPEHVRIGTDIPTMALAMGTGMLGSLVFCLPVFVRIFKITPLMLLRGVPQITSRILPEILRQGIGFMPGAIVFFLLSVFVAGSLTTGSIFAAGFILALACLSGTGWLIFSGCRPLSSTRNVIAKIAFRNLFRNKLSSLSCFVTIAMGVFLISLIPQIQKGLQQEIVRPDGLKIPAFFLIDIQDDQHEPLIEFIKRQEADLTNLSPMVRGRILTVNRRPFQDHVTRSKETAANDRERHGRTEFNFSFRNELDASETIIQGDPLSPVPWQFDSGRPFEVSVEASFAERYHLKIGDLMEFDIQGIPFEGRVKNLRSVKWNSFQPNFFMLFQDGVLNDAPKTFLAAISHVAPENRQDLKNQIVAAFPNISIIDVTRMAATFLSITDQLSLSIRFMAWLAIAAGLVSIFSIARHEAWKNEKQINLLKVLGADFKAIQAIAMLEFGFIGLMAALSAILLGFGFSRAISGYFFDSHWQFDLTVSAIILVLTTAVCMGTALGASRKVMNTKPVTLLADT